MTPVEKKILRGKHLNLMNLRTRNWVILATSMLSGDRGKGLILFSALKLHPTSTNVFVMLEFLISTREVDVLLIDVINAANYARWIVF
uniref:Uncharacterized protein n=1 Tax=Lactuca sativa TaxID=4236 RepID=A0A9R1X1K4_LACSA|nr:hypothetical protein LSAT_V11C700378840 [Lactuca sativa]